MFDTKLLLPHPKFEHPSDIDESRESRKNQREGVSRYVNTTNVRRDGRRVRHVYCNTDTVSLEPNGEDRYVHG